MDEITRKSMKKTITNLVRTRVGVDQAIGSESIAGYLRANGFRDVYDLRRKARDVIRELRREGVPICSKSGKGYFWPAKLEDAIETAEEIAHAARDMQYTASLIKDNARRMFGDQQSLF